MVSIIKRVGGYARAVCIVYTEVVDSCKDWRVLKCGRCLGAGVGDDGGMLTEDEKEGRMEARRWLGIDVGAEEGTKEEREGGDCAGWRRHGRC